MKPIATALTFLFVMSPLISASTHFSRETSVRKMEAPGALPEKKIQGKPQYALTESTEVLLDGRACQFKEVPASATISRMELDADGKTILRLHFRSRR